MIDEKNIFEKGMLISLRMYSWAGRKEMSKEQITKNGLPDEIVRGVFDLFETSYKEKLASIGSFDGKVRGTVKKNSVPFPIDGIFFFPFGKIEELVKYLDEKKGERKALVDEVLEGYEEAKKAYAKKYPDYYNLAKEKYLPKEVIKNKYYFDYQFIKIAPPDKDSVISPEQYKKEVGKFKDTIEEMKKEVVSTIYKVLIETTNTLKSQCKEEKFNQATFTKLNNFLVKVDDLYSEFVDRQDLKNVLKKIKATALGVTAESLRDSSEASKTKFEKAIKDIAAEIKAMPDVPLKRAIEF